MDDPVINSDPQIDEVQRIAEQSSRSIEEVQTQDTSTTTTSKSTDQQQSQRSSKVDKTDETVQEAVQRVLNKDRNPQQDDSPPSDDAVNKTPEEETEDTQEQEDTQKEETEHQEENETDDDRNARVAKEQEEAKARTDAANDAKLSQEERDAKLPFNKHPRFVELTTENRALKQRQSAIDSDIKWRQDNNVDPETYAQSMNMAALFKKDPTAFFNTVTKMKEEFEISTGVRLPADLQQKVDAGKMDETDARELAQARAKATSGERTVLSFKQQQEADRTKQVTQALDSLGKMLQKNDATFKPKANASEPDGLWEYSFNTFLLLQAKTPAKSGLEAQQQFQACYDSVKRSFSAVQPPRRAANRTFTNRSQASRGITPSSARVEPTDARGAVDSMLKKKYGTGLSARTNGNGE
jgi:hypothetical protein